MSSYHEYLPKTWTEVIDENDILKEVFSNSSNQYSPVPDFLFQDLRGGNLKYMKPLFKLYGTLGLGLLERLEEIDRVTADNYKREVDGKIYEAGYFNNKTSTDENLIKTVVTEYIEALTQVYKVICECDQPFNKEIKIEFVNQQEYDLINETIRSEEDTNYDIYTDISDWFIEQAEYKENCKELITLLDEPMYHINNDYFLSFYLRWELLKDTNIENPLLPYYKLWTLGVTIAFKDKDTVIVLK